MLPSRRRYHLTRALVFSKAKCWQCLILVHAHYKTKVSFQIQVSQLAAYLKLTHSAAPKMDDSFRFCRPLEAKVGVASYLVIWAIQCLVTYMQQQIKFKQWLHKDFESKESSFAKEALDTHEKIFQAVRQLRRLIGPCFSAVVLSSCLVILLSWIQSLKYYQYCQLLRSLWG